MYSKSDLDYAYLAGMIDADGFVSIVRMLKANTGRCDPNIYHALKLGISGTNSSPHELAKKLFGGNITKYASKKEEHQDNYQWNCSGPTAAAALYVLLPFLLVKIKQADIGIRFQVLISEPKNSTLYPEAPM